MDKKQRLQSLSNVSLFTGVNDRSMKAIANRLLERQYPAGTRIIEQGAQGFGLFIVVSGKAEVKFEGADGKSTVVNTLTAGDFFGEMALLDDGLRSASVYAVEDTVCLILNRIEFIAIMLKDPALGVLIATELAKRLRRSLESK